MALQTPIALSSVFDMRRASEGVGRALILVSYEIEPEHGTRLSRMDEVSALGRYLRSRLCDDGFWPKDKDLWITVGERQSPVADDSHFAVTLPGYSSAWSAKRFEDAVCLAAKRFIRMLAPRAPVGRYLADFERGGRLFSWSCMAGLKTGSTATLTCDLSRNRFRAWLRVAVPTQGESLFKVYQSGAGDSEWVDLLRKLRVSKAAVTIEADPRMFVRVFRHGRSSARWTGDGASLERFVVDLATQPPRVVQEFKLKQRGPGPKL
jgi:hypothetical protein